MLVITAKVIEAAISHTSPLALAHSHVHTHSLVHTRRKEHTRKEVGMEITSSFVSLSDCVSLSPEEVSV